jgi:hypothetical protein
MTEPTTEPPPADELPRDYSPSARVALSALGEPEPPAPPRSPSSGYGLQEAPNVWTVTIAGSERHDGEAPYTWVVTAANATIAAAIAERHHRINQEDTDTIVRYVDPGAPNANYPYAYNDLRGIPSRLVVLTPDNIRSIAGIRLAYRRLDKQVERVNANPQYATDAGEANVTLDLAADVIVLVRRLMDQLGYGM